MLDYKYFLDIARPDNVNNLFQFLINISLKSVEIKYSNDSSTGKIESFDFNPLLNNEDAHSNNITWLIPELSNESENSLYKLKSIKLNIFEALEYFVLQRIDHLYPGWNKKQKLFGKIVIDVDTRSYKIYHPLRNKQK